ncbi:hypothetical protein BJY24_004661 [Nocardia transvalensis]|uniref:DUF8176 domain-containing protein n=1 Tax=Nocardia transvalensis TaxID=37333 RepID=A0A7W9PHI4_9NOCA|nr:hypothetical protein [Nocardia transvalensis]MBB5915749.1 hypothetical protein [Nocardia transvalensis]
MLKSYKDLERWYPALEPPGDAVRPPAGEQPTFADDEAGSGAGRYPHYIRETEPEPFDIPFAADPSGRDEFTGGWTDWVGDHAPGPDDDYPARDDTVVRLPWDDEDPEPRTLGRSHAGTDRSGRIGRDGPGAASPHTLRERARPNRLRAAVVLVIAVLLLGLAGALALYLLHSRGAATHSGSLNAPAVRLTAATGDGSAAGFCPTERADRVVRGAEPGGTASGPDAIMWFQYSYYVERSAERALEVVAPGTVLSPASVIQRGIDSVPLGTAHCVRVSTVTEDKYSVEVTERRPGGAPKTYGKQTVTTAVIGGRTLITGIAAG